MNLSTFANHVKSTLVNLINEIDTGSGNYVLHPGRDFTRNRKLGFLQTMLLILVLSRCSLPKELADIFKFDCTRASVPAFTQQRRKIRHEALYSLFMGLNERFPCRKLYKKKYRLLACDGTRLNCPLNKSDAESLHSLGKSPFNQQHLTALFDLMEHRFIDAVVQPLHKMNEYASLRQIVSRLRSDIPSIIMADRGFCSIDNCVHLQESGCFYLLRAKASDMKWYLDHLNISPGSVFDRTVTVHMTRSAAVCRRNDGRLYRKVYNSHLAGILRQGSQDIYSLPLRIAGIRLENGAIEYLMTNLPADEFNTMELAELYHLRWGIETSFCKLKYDTGLVYLHSRNPEFILQEIYAKLVMYNFSSIIITEASRRNRHNKKEDRKYDYKENMSNAIHACFAFLRGMVKPTALIKEIQGNVLPVRPGRSSPRNVRPQTAKPLCYR